jgi:hypothetical protein
LTQGGTAPSTGFVGIYLALAVCGNITTFGFSRQVSGASFFPLYFRL